MRFGKSKIAKNDAEYPEQRRNEFEAGRVSVDVGVISDTKSNKIVEVSLKKRKSPS